MEGVGHFVTGKIPRLTSLCEKSPGSAIGRRNRPPHHGKPSSYRPVGQAVSPVERLFTQTLTPGVIAPSRELLLQTMQTLDINTDA
jgi:hypothetical protein